MLIWKNYGPEQLVELFSSPCPVVALFVRSVIFHSPQRLDGRFRGKSIRLAVGKGRKLSIAMDGCSSVPGLFKEGKTSVPCGEESGVDDKSRHKSNNVENGLTLERTPAWRPLKFRPRRKSQARKG